MGRNSTAQKRNYFPSYVLSNATGKSTHLLIGLCRKQRQNGNISFTQLNMKAKKFVLHI